MTGCHRLHPVFVHLAGVGLEVVALDPRSLATALVGQVADGGAQADGHVGASGPLEELGDDPGPIRGLALVGDDELEVDLGGLQEQGQGPRVVDVVADVGVEDDGDPGGLRAGGLGGAEKVARQEKAERDKRQCFDMHEGPPRWVRCFDGGHYNMRVERKGKEFRRRPQQRGGGTVTRRCVAVPCSAEMHGHATARGRATHCGAGANGAAGIFVGGTIKLDMPSGLGYSSKWCCGKFNAVDLGRCPCHRGQKKVKDCGSG
ncbi:MAG: hypothetical protein NTU94_07765 [Planctomycetota bacterium]|nr:hypothetical protein [Planctomycetota bacterium]